jgi:protein-S-isoprenylcysteine O-methyltransferase Ste14
MAALLAAAFGLAHIAAPWALSLLSRRYGWEAGRPGPWNLLALLLVIPGLAFTAWMVTVHYRASPNTFVQFQQGNTLMTPGPYALSRNPMYVVELAFWLGWALFYGSLTVLIGFLLWFGLFVFVLVPSEERDLEARFGEAYRAYKQAVPRWLGWRRG